MRTTLDIDDDLLSAAKELARRDGVTAGQMVSRLLRRSLTSPAQASPSARTAKAAGPTAGFLPFPARPGVIATNDHVNALRDAEGV
jgi:Arc/MetJ family transcription regulator